MKSLICVLIVLFLIPSCKNDDFDEPDVRTFVAMIKSGSYDYCEINDAGNPLWLRMPVFSGKNIPDLLELATDTTHIGAFPLNPISSVAPERLILGECLLWIVEGIRINRPYASLNPLLAVRYESQNSRTELTGDDVLKVYRIYQEWWEKVKGDPYLMKQINPLKGTPYFWR